MHLTDHCRFLNCSVRREGGVRYEFITYRSSPLQTALFMDFPHSNPYVPPYINNSYINSYCELVMDSTLCELYSCESFRAEFQFRIRFRAKSWIRIRIKVEFQKLQRVSRQSRGRPHWRLTSEPCWRVCRPVVANSNHCEVAQGVDPDPR